MTLSTSQKTFLREAAALEKMPKTPGEAACRGNTAFDIITQTEKVSKEKKNKLAETCAQCPLWDCGWRLVKTD